MRVLFVGAREVEELLPMVACMNAMEGALKALARGDALLPLRTITWMKDRRGAIGLMPSHLGDPPLLGLKAVSVFPGNSGTPYESHQGAVMLFETEHGRPLAFVEAGSITAIRTAAVSGVATRHMAREDADVLAILGTGTQARTHIDAMLAARPIARIKIWGKSPEAATRLAEETVARHGIAAEVMNTAENAAANASIICTVTASATPVLLGDWLSPGTHINAVGACMPAARELDGAAVACSRLVVDSRESALAESGDILLAVKEGAIGEDHIACELGEILLGKESGRKGPEEITLFKSLGLSVEDLAAAHLVHAQAREKGLGTWVEWGAERDASS